MQLTTQPPPPQHLLPSGTPTYALVAVGSYEREPAHEVVERAAPGDVVHQHRSDGSSKKRLRYRRKRKITRRIPNLFFETA